ncbi:UNVERIFIED_CONTAM: hypothetical protein Sradi_2779900, partial [Sesamum radiatum]
MAEAPLQHPALPMSQQLRCLFAISPRRFHMIHLLDSSLTMAPLLPDPVLMEGYPKSLLSLPLF